MTNDIVSPSLVSSAFPMLVVRIILVSKTLIEGVCGKQWTSNGALNDATSCDCVGTVNARNAGR